MARDRHIPRPAHGAKRRVGAPALSRAAKIQILAFYALRVVAKRTLAAPPHPRLRKRLRRAPGTRLAKPGGRLPTQAANLANRGCARNASAVA